MLVFLCNVRGRDSVTFIHSHSSYAEHGWIPKPIFLVKKEIKQKPLELKLVNIRLWNFRAIRIILNWTVAFKMVLHQFVTCDCNCISQVYCEWRHTTDVAAVKKRKIASSISIPSLAILTLAADITGRNMTTVLVIVHATWCDAK